MGIGDGPSFFYPLEQKRLDKQEEAGGGIIDNITAGDSVNQSLKRPRPKAAKKEWVALQFEAMKSELNVDTVFWPKSSSTVSGSIFG